MFQHFTKFHLPCDTDFYFAYNKWGGGNLNPSSPHGGGWAMPLSHKALGGIEFIKPAFVTTNG